MGLFSSDSDDTNYSDEFICELVENAESDTVTGDRLTQTDTSGVLSGGIKMNDSAFLEYLEDEEQPNFILYGTTSFNHPNFNYCITDKAIIIVASKGSNDSSFRIPFSSIRKTRCVESGPLGKTLKITVEKPDTIKEFKRKYEFDWRNANRDEIYLDISNDIDNVRLENYLDERILVSGHLSDDVDVTEMGRIGYYSFNSDENFIDRAGVLGLSEDTIEVATTSRHKEINTGDIVNVNEYQTFRIKTYTERGSLDFEEDIEKTTGLEIVTKNRESISFSVRKRGEYPNIPERLLEYIGEKYIFGNANDGGLRYTLVNPFGNDGSLKVEGWTDGDSLIQAEVDADAETKGKSLGVEVGPFTRSKSRSKSSIGGEISGEISDNTYSSEIICFRVYEERLLIDSDIKLDLHYSELDNIYQQEDGVVIEVGSTTFRIDGVSVPDQIGDAVAFIKEQMDTFAEEETTPDDEEGPVDSADKLRELKKLHEDGILTDDEFESKKEDLLDDF